MKRIFLLALLACLALVSFAQNSSQALQVGSTAPLFVAKDQNGKLVSLKEMTKKGNVVLIFYRGQWCPYCNRELKHLEDSLNFITEKGASVIAVTPETSDNVNKTIEKTKASYSILSDDGLKIMKAYKVAFDVDQATIDKYKTFGVDFNKANGANGAVLPVPAVYIIDKNGKIKYAYFDTDYRNRASIKDLADHL